MTQDDDLFDDPDQYQSHPQHSHHQHQGAQRWKGLTERLVESCTPFSTGSTNFKACVDFALSSFSNNKHLTTDERKMEASYKGLVEKFDLFGDFLKAEALDNLLQAALKGPTSTFDDFKIHDVLRLLLLLSSSPLKERYEPPLEKIELTPEELWDAILSEDPLIGDHWEVQRRSSEDSNDESLYDTDIETDEERSENHLGNSPVPADETPDPDTTLYVSEVSDESNEDAGMFSLDFNIDGMRELLPLQYWTLPKKKFSCAGNRSFSADNPNSLNPALSAEQISSPSFFGIPITPTSYVNETDVLRECFSLCLGLPSEIFLINTHGLIHPLPEISIRHMSHSTLLRLLRPVAKFGEGVRSIESFLSRTNILSRDGASIGVLEAFSAEIGAVLKEFKETILGMEKLFRQRDANAALPGVSSLLSFIKSLSSAFWPLQQMIAFLHKFRLIDTVQSKITVQDDVACTILDGMYSEILLSENCGDLRKRSLYVHALLRSLRPCFMEFGLWYSGSFIPRDSVGLALKINKGVSFHEMEFWRTRYLILDKVPRVLKAVLDKIVLCGKYMELLRFFDVSQASKYADSSRILFEKFITMLDHPLRNSGALPVILPSIRKETAGTSAKSTDSTLFLFPELNIQMGPNNLKLPEPRLQSDFNKIIHFHTEDEWNTLQPFQLSFSRKFSHDIDPYLSQLEQELMKRIRRGSTLEERFNILRTAFLIKPTGIIELCDGLEELMRTRSGMEPYLIDKIFREALLGKIYLKELYGIEDFGFGFDENPGLPLISVKFFESLRITCELSWPLNALVTSESLQNYNLAASFQLQLFWVHRQLSTTAWRGNRNLLKSSNGDSSLRKRSILFQTMSSFCNSLLQFFCNTVIGGLSDAFSVDLAAKRGIDAIIGLHDTFVQDIVHKCFLGTKSRTLLKAIRSCLDECLEYVEMFRKMDEERVEMDRQNVAEVSETRRRKTRRSHRSHYSSMAAIRAPLYPATLAFETRFPILYQRFQEQRRFIADTVRLMGSVGAPELAYLSLALSF